MKIINKFYRNTEIYFAYPQLCILRSTLAHFIRLDVFFISWNTTA